ncbi:PREDICTED: UDP-glucuronosyltransferase 2C1 [Dufourea novaeangliae]|uniref:UDP-glucuronosyltransferase n=1 Tax=Dufourea novaeangliae TaxID=178035 RepID=A0A154PNR0_DUFNO|nr:PREDICTED: UDP-glucuronosyltransferase 2C1 [Dufourea novaeangliae]KZC13493.1 2-hydroxyacylsphingosine 1-beta-galactosyltransferase [Dufourea novaeangliae]
MIDRVFVLLTVVHTILDPATGYNVLMATMGGTKSHTVPFVALGTSLKARGHNVTLVSAFPGPAANNGLQEFVPPIFEAYVGNYTSEWDLVGARFRNELPISPWDAMRYAWEACEALLRDEVSVTMLRKPDGNPRARWDVAVVDGAFPECLLGVLHRENVPTIMLNTVALYSGSIGRQGNPSPWSVTPYFGKSFTQDMNIVERVLNVACLLTLRIMHWIMVAGYVQPVLRRYLGDQLPDVRDLTAEVPLTLQNSHYSVADSVPYLANVVNVACLHCNPASKLSNDLDSFLQRGFIFVSMGSSVRASGMPEALRQMFVAAFATVPCNVVWKWEGGKIKDLPSNVRTAAWWPQQDLLGHPKLRAFVSHGGLLSLHEAAYHGAPTLVLPVFCDHDGNAAQAEKLGYALVMDLASISIGNLREGILKVAAVHNNSYRTAAKKRSSLLRELPISPTKLATWWVEHVAKYKGAEHLKSSTRYMGVIHYYSIDVVIFYAIMLLLLVYGLKKLCWRTISKEAVNKKKLD